MCIVIRNINKKKMKNPPTKQYTYSVRLNGKAL